MSAQNFLKSAHNFTFERKTWKTGTFLYFGANWQSLFKSYMFLTISVHISVQNCMKIDSDCATKITFRRSGQLNLLNCADNNTFKNTFVVFVFFSGCICHGYLHCCCYRHHHYRHSTTILIIIIIIIRQGTSISYWIESMRLKCERSRQEAGDSMSSHLIFLPDSLSDILNVVCFTQEWI